MEPARQNSGTGAVIAGFAALYLLVCLCLGTSGYALYAASRQPFPNTRGYFPTLTAMPDATPVVHKPAADDKVIQDDFSDNKHAWISRWSDGTLAIKNGRLSLSTSAADSIEMAQCNVCPFLGNKYYIEADLSTSQSVDSYYGIAFNINNSYHDFYVFEINTQIGRFDLYKTIRSPVSGDDIWMKRLSKNSSLIKPYPQVNKLGVYFDRDSMQLYINENQVESYQDIGTDLSSGAYAFYIEDPGFALMVDNFFAYGK